jgi:hypothetical protein
MISYRDKTFCDGLNGSCKHFGKDCSRSLTSEVLTSAEQWWNPKGDKTVGQAPISKFIDASQLDCYERKENA